MTLLLYKYSSCTLGFLKLLEFLLLAFETFEEDEWRDEFLSMDYLLLNKS